MDRTRSKLRMRCREWAFQQMDKNIQRLQGGKNLEVGRRIRGQMIRRQKAAVEAGKIGMLQIRQGLRRHVKDSERNPPKTGNC